MSVSEEFLLNMTRDVKAAALVEMDDSYASTSNADQVCLSSVERGEGEKGLGAGSRRFLIWADQKSLDAMLRPRLLCLSPLSNNVYII